MSRLLDKCGYVEIEKGDHAPESRQAVKRSPSTGFRPDETSPLAQVGALCWRISRTRDLQVLLVTSRETGRWVLPKGWPVPGLTDPVAAAREAWEEAGVRGPVGAAAVGAYDYDKVLDRDLPGPPTVACRVTVYPLAAGKRQHRFPEAGQRRVKWFPRDKAAAKVTEPGLAAIIAGFDPAAPAVTAPVTGDARPPEGRADGATPGLSADRPAATDT